MRYFSIKYIPIAILLVFITLRSEGQFPKKKIIFRSGIITGFCCGSSEYIYKNGSFPKLFSNYRETSGAGASVIYLINDHMGAGLSFRSLSLRDWNLANLHDYDSSGASVTSCKPVFYLQTSPLVNNVFTFFLLAGPSVSRVRVNLDYPVFFTENLSGDFIPTVLSSDNINLGFDLTAGLLISVNETFGISVAGSSSIIKTSSVIYPDKALSTFTLEAGIKIKFLKDKRYYY
jgi:hypothetical protein